MTSTTNYGSVNTQITRQDPNIEKYRRALLADVQQFIANQVAAPQAPPAYQVAGLGQPELDAITLASQGVGQYAPYLQGGANAIIGGQNYIQQGGLPALQQAMSSMGGGQQFINQAAQLANNTRNIPYAYQAAANQGIQDSVQLGTGMGANALGQLQQSTALGSTLANLGGESRRFGFDAAADIANQPGASVGSTQSAQQMLGGTTGQFDPSGIGAFMSQYEDQAVQQALADVARQGDIQRNQIAAQAVGQGAFGGSRSAIAEAENRRNVLEQQGRTAAQMRSAGFTDAATRAQTAYEQAQGRGQKAAEGIAGLGLGQARLGLQGSQAAGQMGIAGLGQAGTQTQAGANIGLQGGQAMGNLANQMGNLGLQGAQQQGNLGLQFGQLGQADIAQLLAMGGQQQNLGQGIGALAGQYGQFGTQLGNLGGQQANVGSMLSNLSAQDLSNLITTGALERGVRQSGLDATRLTTTAQNAQPYQQYGFLSDIYMGVPTSQQTVTATSSPQISPFQTALGLGIQGLSAAGGARNAGLF